MAPQHIDWHDLAEQASKEMDSVKLMSLVEQLNLALAQHNNFKKGSQALAPA
jgi:hypothetical protein